MASKSKAKGYRQEVALSKILSKWSGRTFNRTPSSGALRWSGASWTFCDLVPPEDLPILLEAKHHAAMSIEGLLIDRNKITDWWDELKRDQARAEEQLSIVLFPMLVFRRDHGRNFLMIEHRAWDKLPRLNPDPRKRVRGLCLVGMQQDTVICDFNDFLATVTPEKIQQYVANPLWHRNPILRSKRA